MSKYQVRIDYEGTRYYLVEANDAVQARIKARQAHENDAEPQDGLSMEAIDRVGEATLWEPDTESD